MKQGYRKSLGIVIVLIGGLLQNCHRDRNLLLQGTWKVDSVYSFYNGFTNVEKDVIDLEEYTYLPDGNVDVTWHGSTKSWKYQLVGSDSLVYFEDQREVSRYSVLSFHQRRLVLRKELSPIFGGKGQDRYEIRFFSKK